MIRLYSKKIESNRIYARTFRFFIKYILNVGVNKYFGVSNSDISLSGTEGVIVSLTSFPERIEKIWIVVECLFRQTIRPSKVVLTLSKLQFNSEADLPKKLLEQKKRGLEILWTDDDIRSHKKYYYVMQKYPKSIVVTVDDDFFYESTMLEKLLEFHEIYPDCVVCNLAALKVGNEYSDWKNLFFLKVEPCSNIMQYGGSGVLYPPNCLYKDAFDKDIFLDICPLADDIWLNYMTILKGTKIVKTDYPYYLVPIIFKKNKELYRVNVDENFNNIQINNLNTKYLDVIKERL